MIKEIDLNRVPKHIAIIMDGNGRWAKKRMLPRLAGHKAGVSALKRVVKAGEELGVKIMSFYAFSTENWKRDNEEVYGIFDLVRKHLKENFDTFINRNIKIQTMGDISRLPEDLYKMLLDITEKTKNNTGLIVNMGLSYGGRSELVRAFNNLIQKGVKQVTEEDIQKELYTCNIDDPDLIIRTSGEQRLSNFMLYQAAYSELYFPKVHWPDFNKKHLEKAIIEFQSRDRRYGNIKQEIKK
ncbi:MAG: isoprenyl transferase [Clostridia bacterium]|nr:isoprenyl transferase [Clostridia bacterium]